MTAPARIPQWLGVDDERRVALCEWLISHGISPDAVPLDDHLTVTPIAEGRLQVDYHRAPVDGSGRIVPVLPGATYEHAVTVVDTAPPGYDPARSLTWDAFVYLRHLEDLPR